MAAPPGLTGVVVTPSMAAKTQHHDKKPLPGMPGRGRAVLITKRPLPNPLCQLSNPKNALVSRGMELDLKRHGRRLELWPLREDESPRRIHIAYVRRGPLLMTSH